MSLADDLKALQELHEKGELSDGEYGAAKAAIIGGTSTHARSLRSLPTSVQIPPSKKSVGCLTAILAIGGAIILVAIIVNFDTSSPALPQNSVQPIATITGNVASDRLSGMSESEQAKFLALVVEEGCLGTKAFYMGSYAKDNSAFWSVGCGNGKAYEVQIAADSAGSTKVLECSVLKAIAHVNCFEKFN